jgi:predicted MPP superfamily phosphohydrolase
MSFRTGGLVGPLLLASCLLALSGFMFIEPNQVEITHHEMRSDTTQQGFRLVQLSDLHLHAFGEQEKLVVKHVNDQRPDLIVLTGDMIDRSDALPVLQEFIEALSPTPVYAIPGNWEHWSDLDFHDLRAAIETQQLNRLLLNDQSSFEKSNRTIQLVGLDDFTGGNPDLGLLERLSYLHKKNITTVILEHSPGFFDLPEVRRLMPSNQRFLCLSGHTHGGQITIGGWAPFTPRGSGHFVAGFYDVPGCQLYVSRGIGTSIISARIGSRPEIAIFDF